MNESISRQFAKWASALTYEDLPANVVDKIKALVLIHLVAAVFGQQNSHARDLVELLKIEGSKADGASILGDGTAVTREAATTADCELMHVAGLWDSYRMITHPGSGLVAAALVNGEVERRSMKDVITALAAGYEFVCRLADDFVPSTAAQGFRPAPVFATMGAALVTASLLGLDEDRIVATIAIAANCASGLNESSRSGGGDQRFHEANAARQGVFAAMMASLGHIKGSERAIEGDAGFYHAFAGSNNGQLSYVFTGPRRIDLASVTDSLGLDYKLLTVMFRMYPCPGYNQPVIDLMSELKRRHQIDSDQVEEVTISMNYLETLYPSPEFPQFADPSTARVGATQYFAAHAAVNGGFPVVGGAPFGPTGDDLENDQRVLEFMANRVRLIGVHDQPMFSPSISIAMKDGTIHRGEYPYRRLEWSFDQLVERLRDCVPGLPGGQQQLDILVSTMREAEKLSSVGPLLAAVAGG